MSVARVSKAKIKKAIKGSGGIISAVARASGYAWMSVRRMIDEQPDLLELLRAEEETVLDVAESVVLTGLKEGDLETAKYVLNTKGRRRGWGREVALTGANGGPVKIESDPTLDARKLSELARLLAEAQAAQSAALGAGADGETEFAQSDAHAA